MDKRFDLVFQRVKPVLTSLLYVLKCVCTKGLVVVTGLLHMLDVSFDQSKF